MPSTPTHPLVAFAYNNAWANVRLYRACSRLDPAELVATRTNFFPSIAKTLNHLLTVDWFYIDALERAVADREPNPAPYAFFDPEFPYDAVADLAREQRLVDRRLVGLVVGMTPEDHVRPVAILRRTGLVVEEAHRILGHLLEHQIHHRGQVHAMLAGTSVAPPQLDEFFLANEAHLRAEELAELGWTEATMWGPSRQ